jgi:hypothetical protein
VSVPPLSRGTEALENFASATRYQPRSVLFTRSWAHDQFDPEPFNRLAARGALPVLSWEPWDDRQQGGKDARQNGYQPEYRLSRITAGSFDDYIVSYARGVKALGYRVAIRFGHEMNGFWYPWCEQTNGNAPGDYVRAYQHVHNLFTALGTTNVIWVWSPNVSFVGGAPLAPLFPGDRYVDWLGLSGYYGIVRPEYVTFDSVFAATIDKLRALSHRPLVLTEIAATDAIGRKADWIADMFRSLPRYPEIIGVMWFEFVKETDWRVVSSRGAVAAFASGAANPRYDTRWTLASVPRTDPPLPASPSPTRSTGTYRPNHRTSTGDNP